MTKMNPKPESVKGVVDYLFSIPANPITLTSIIPDGKTATRTFNKKSDRAVMSKWIATEQAAGRNVYYQDCSVRSLNARPKKEHVATIHCAHVDCDAKGPQAQLAPDKGAILAKLRAYVPAPTDIIDTGNGLQAFWYLQDPMPATPDNIARIEAINRRLADDLAGDRCHDVAHLMRVPLFNFPNAKKIKSGRVVCEGRIIEADHAGFANFRVDELPQGTVEGESDDVADGDAKSDDAYVRIGSPEIPDSVDLSRLNDPGFVEQIIKGPKGETFGAGASDSEFTYNTACQLRRAGFTDGEILHVITNPDYAAAAHIMRQKQRQPISQAARLIEDMNRKGVSGGRAADDFDDDYVSDAAKEKFKAERAAKAERAKAKASDGTEDIFPDDEPAKILTPTPYKIGDWTKKPPRDWLYAQHYIRKFVVADVSPGAGGKTSHVLAEAVSMASGVDLLSYGWMYPQQLKVWYWNGEDPREEVERRLDATVKHYSMGDDDIEGYLPPLNADALVRLQGNLMTDTGREMPIKIATEAGSTGPIKIATPLIDALVAMVIEHKIDVVIIDPFIDSHGVNENDNTKIEQVAAQWRMVAEKAGCCVSLVHHTRKSKPGAEVEYGAADARGAGALVAAARDVRVYNRMTAEEADDFGIIGDRWRYFRVESDKPNMSVRGGAGSPWRMLASVSMGNAMNGMPADSVGVACYWAPPERNPMAEAALRKLIIKAARSIFDDGRRVTRQNGPNAIKNMLPLFQRHAKDATIKAKDVKAAFAEAERLGTWKYQEAQEGSRVKAGYVPVDPVEPTAGEGESEAGAS